MASRSVLVTEVSLSTCLSSLRSHESRSSPVTILPLSTTAPTEPANNGRTSFPISPLGTSAKLEEKPVATGANRVESKQEKAASEDAKIADQHSQNAQTDLSPRPLANSVLRTRGAGESEMPIREELAVSRDDFGLRQLVLAI